MATSRALAADHDRSVAWNRISRREGSGGEQSQNRRYNLRRCNVTGNRYGVTYVLTRSGPPSRKGSEKTSIVGIIDELFCDVFQREYRSCDFLELAGIAHGIFRKSQQLLCERPGTLRVRCLEKSLQLARNRMRLAEKLVEFGVFFVEIDSRGEQTSSNINGVQWAPLPQKSIGKVIE